MNDPHERSISAWLTVGWNTYKMNAATLIVGASAYVGLTLINMIIQLRMDLIWPGYVIGLFVGGPLTVGWLYLSLKCVRGEDVSASEVFSGFTRYGSSLLTSFLFYLAIGIGFVLCVVPGVYLALKYGQCLFAVMDKRMSTVDAFEYSGKITDGYKIMILGMGLIAFIINVPTMVAAYMGAIYTVSGGDGFLAVFIGGQLLSVLFLYPFMGACWAALYESLAYEKNSTPEVIELPYSQGPQDTPPLT